MLSPNVKERRKEIEVMLQVLSDQAHGSVVDSKVTVIEDVKLDSFKWIIEEAIKMIHSNGCGRPRKEK